MFITLTVNIFLIINLFHLLLQNVTRIIIKEEKIFILIDLPDILGEYRVICNTSNEQAILPEQEVKLVNSRLITVISVFPAILRAGQHADVR